jgi:hypothetical protein
MDFYPDLFPGQGPAQGSFDPPRRLVAGVSELIRLTQQDTCRRWGAYPATPPDDARVLVATPLRPGRVPIYGFRAEGHGDESGWHLWQDRHGGRIPDTFRSVTINEIAEQVLPIMRYLALPAGWRFSVANDQESVWKDRLNLARYSLSQFPQAGKRATQTTRQRLRAAAWQPAGACGI